MDRKLLDFEIEPLNISELREAEESSEQSDGDHESDEPESEEKSSNHNNGFEASKQHEQGTCESGASSDQSSQLSTISQEDEVVFIKLLLPLGKIFTITAYCNMNIRQLKNILSDEFQIPADIIDLWENAEYPKLITDENVELSFLNIKNNRLELYVNSRDPDIELYIPEDKFLASTDILTVTLEGDKQVVVEIENCIERKFLGGFRCRKTGKEYLHSETQTHVRYIRKTSVNKAKWSRTCQTNEIIDFYQQTSISQATQTIQPSGDEDGVIIEARTDGSSTEADSDLQFLTSKVVTIQRIWRGWLARKHLEQSKIKEKEHAAKSVSKVVKHEEGYSPAVFEVLYQLVDRWRKKCLDYAYMSKTEGPSRADFQDILEMQVNLLAIIERERVKMRHNLQKEKERRLLEESCSPVTWKGYRGVTISMDTIHSQRAAELKKLYDLLSQENISPQQRRENLSTIQVALKNEKDSKCVEILTLLSRELQLLDMGFGYKEIESLHKRIEKLFINFIKDPKVTKNISKDKFYLCIQCKKMLPPTSFVIPLNEPAIKLCASCHWIDNISHKRVDHNPYQLILRELRREEMRRGCYKSLAFVMEVHDVRHLVEQVWHCQSAISQSADLRDLRLGRWNATDDWAPWNTILLTKSELQQHLAITELDKIYGQNFIKNIKVKLLMAQMHFKSLFNLNFDL